MKSKLLDDDDNATVLAIGVRLKSMAAGFLKKPFDATQLANAIEMALSPGDDWNPRTQRA